MNQIIRYLEELSVDWRLDMRANTFASPLEYMEALFPGTQNFILYHNPSAVAETIEFAEARRLLSSWLNGGIFPSMKWVGVTRPEREHISEYVINEFMNLLPDAEIITFGSCKDKAHDYAEEGFIMLIAKKTVAAIYLRSDV